MTSQETVIVEMRGLGLQAELGKPQERDLTLAAGQIRGDHHLRPPVRSRVLLGGPDAAKMKPRANESPDIDDRRADADFWSVLMALTFVPANPEIFASAWLRVDLSAENQRAAPIAFIIQPGRTEDEVSVDSSVGIEASIKAAKVAGSKKRTFKLHEAEILATGRLRSNPGWDIHPSSGRPIAGGADFLLVVKTALGTTGAGRVSFGATIEWPPQGLFGRLQEEVSWQAEPVTFRIQ